MLTLKSMKEKIYLAKSNIKFIKIFIYIQIRFVFLLIKSFEFMNILSNKRVYIIISNTCNNNLYK